MILNEHISGYICSLAKDLPESLAGLEREALERGVPIIRKDMQRLLQFLLIKEKPEAILEIGTAVGFSTLLMRESAPPDTMITTIEKVEMRLKDARKNLRNAVNVRLIEEDANKALKELRQEGGKYDLVFLDAAKGQYLSWLEDILSLMPKGGILVTDNVLLEGSIAESKFIIERRDRTIHKRMRDYLYELTHDARLETIILPVGDGAAISIVL